MRDTPPDVVSALGGDYQAFELVELHFDSQTMYLAAAPHDVVVGSQVYSAAQGIASIEPITETINGVPGLRFAMPLVSPAAITSALTEKIQGRKIVIRLGVVTPSGVNADEIAWVGTLDAQTLSFEDGRATVSVTSECDFIRWNRPIGTLMSDAEHRRTYPNDPFFEFTPELEDATVVWPDKTFYYQ